MLYFTGEARQTKSPRLWGRYWNRPKVAAQNGGEKKTNRIDVLNFSRNFSKFILYLNKKWWDFVPTPAAPPATSSRYALTAAPFYSPSARRRTSIASSTPRSTTKSSSNSNSGNSSNNNKNKNKNKNKNNKNKNKNNHKNNKKKNKKKKK